MQAGIVPGSDGHFLVIFCCSMWTLNKIVSDPICKRRRRPFRTNKDEPLNIT